MRSIPPKIVVLLAVGAVTVVLLSRRSPPLPLGPAADASLAKPAIARPPAVATREPAPDRDAPAPVVDQPFAERDAGYGTIATLQHEGEFDRAAAYALAADPAVRRDLIVAAFHDWARLYPEAAFARVVQIPEAPARAWALQSVLSGWASADPSGLAELALRFPSGHERDAALTKALREWMHRDPWAAGDWILAQDIGVQRLAEKMFETENR